MRRFILLLVGAGLMLAVGCKSCASPESPASSQESTSTSDCVEPENPYAEGSGHYAGYEWAEQNGSGTCGGNSQSFTEGCEEHESQEAEYEECEAKKQH